MFFFYHSSPYPFLPSSLSSQQFILFESFSQFSILFIPFSLQAKSAKKKRESGGNGALPSYNPWKGRKLAMGEKKMRKWKSKSGRNGKGGMGSCVKWPLGRIGRGELGTAIINSHHKKGRRGRGIMPKPRAAYPFPLPSTAINLLSPPSLFEKNWRKGENPRHQRADGRKGRKGRREWMRTSGGGEWEKPYFLMGEKALKMSRGRRRRKEKVLIEWKMKKKSFVSLFWVRGRK
jgi:hypothetical protein